MTVEAEARQILSSVAAMVKAHRVQHVGYIYEAKHVTLPQAPLCNGFEACAIGALYLSAGVRPRRGVFGDHELPGTERTDAYVARHGSPALKLAYAALNAAALRALKRMGSLHIENREGTDGFDSAVERYFECEVPTTEEMLRVVQNARRSIKVPA